MTTKQVRCQFLCEKRQLEFKHDIPSSLVGPAALGNPAMPQMFTTVMRPIVMEHAEASLKACEDKCSSKDCKRDATTVVATPMSVSERNTQHKPHFLHRHKRFGVGRVEMVVKSRAPGC